MMPMKKDATERLEKALTNPPHKKALVQDM